MNDEHPTAVPAPDPYTQGRVVNYHKNGTTLVNSLVMSPLRDAAGIVSHYIGIQRLASAESLNDAPAEYQFRAAL